MRGAAAVRGVGALSDDGGPSPSRVLLVTLLWTETFRLSLIMSKTLKVKVTLLSVQLFVAPWADFPWDSPGQDTGVGSVPFSSASLQPKGRTQVSLIAGGS